MDIFKWHIFKHLDVACAEREVQHDYSCDEPFDHVGYSEDTVIGVRVGHGGDEAEIGTRAAAVVCEKVDTDPYLQRPANNESIDPNSLRCHIDFCLLVERDKH